jgi:hypothetical protein
VERGTIGGGEMSGDYDLGHIMDVAFEGEPEVTARDRHLIERVMTNLDAAGFVIRKMDTAVVMRDGKIKGLKLPIPRLQLRWDEENEEGWVCNYELVIKLGKGDCRRDLSESGIMAIPLGRTVRTSSHSPITDGVVDTPFRDGAHIKWDSKQLSLPMYAIYGNTATEIKQTIPSEYWDCPTCEYSNNQSDSLCGDCGRERGLPDATRRI